MQPDHQTAPISNAIALEPKKMRPKLLSNIPQHYLDNPLLNEAIEVLPASYNFEIPKTLYRIDTLKKQLGRDVLNVSLQLPEGLMLFGCILCDIIKTFTNSNTVILGDVTYGACCVDDLASDQLNCDLLVHYGHSCLVPITETKRKVLYIFVEIDIDVQHLVDTLIHNFKEKHKRYYLMGTIQFNSTVFQARQLLNSHGFLDVQVPQEKPRSGGEILGCTSPKLEDHQAKQQNHNVIIFVCDGRFHMEAAMIANPHYTFYQYDPYTRIISEERYDNNLMIKHRVEEIGRAGMGQNGGKICFILGTLGRQGNPAILDRLIHKIAGRFEYMILLASEIDTELLNQIEVDFYVQIACPRLSIDWASGTPRPLLTPFELFRLMDNIELHVQDYSMDFYSYNGGQWSNFYGKAPVKNPKKCTKQGPKKTLQLDEHE